MFREVVISEGEIVHAGTSGGGGGEELEERFELKVTSEGAAPPAACAQRHVQHGARAAAEEEEAEEAEEEAERKRVVCGVICGEEAGERLVELPLELGVTKLAERVRVLVSVASMVRARAAGRVGNVIIRLGEGEGARVATVAREALKALHEDGLVRLHALAQQPRHD